MLYDITSALIPLLNLLYSNSKAVGIFDVIMNEVLSNFLIEILNWNVIEMYSCS